MNNELSTTRSQDDSSAQVEVIDPTAIVSIRFGVGYYQRIQRMIEWLTENRTVAEIDEVHQMIETQQVPADGWQAHYLTLLIFSSDYEKQVRSEKLFTKKTLSELTPEL